MTVGQHAAQVAGHAVVGCAQGSAAGGSCRGGAISAGFSAAAGPSLPGENLSLTRFVAQVAVGAVASRLGGGSFENGAITAAFGYLFNQAGAKARELGCVFTCLTTVLAARNDMSLDEAVAAGEPFRKFTGPAIAVGASSGALALFGSAGLTVLGTDTAAFVTVTSWARAGTTMDLAAGRWVMMGEATTWNFVRTGLWGPQYTAAQGFFWNSAANYSSITGVVAASQVVRANGWESYTRLFGQWMIRKQ